MQSSVLMGGKGGVLKSVLKQKNPRAYLAATEEEQEPSGEGCIMTRAVHSSHHHLLFLFCSKRKAQMEFVTAP